MEAIFKIQPAELDQRLFKQIKKMFEGKAITITIATEMDETEYLNSNPANREHLLESIAQEPHIKFTLEEFKEKTSKL